LRPAQAGAAIAAVLEQPDFTVEAFATPNLNSSCAARFRAWGQADRARGNFTWRAFG